MDLLPFPELPGIQALHPVEEASEGGDFSEMELVGDLGDAQRSLAQQECGLHEKHLIDVIYDGAATGHLADNTREVGGSDAEFGSVEADVVVLGEVLG